MLPLLSFADPNNAFARQSSSFSPVSARRPFGAEATQSIASTLLNAAWNASSAALPDAPLRLPFLSSTHKPSSETHFAFASLLRLTPDAQRLLTSSSFASIVALTVSIVLLVYATTNVSSKKGSLLQLRTANKDGADHPPIVHIPADVQLSAAGHAAYARALDEEGHGDVVVIPRHGRREYVVDHAHAKAVLCDAQSYSFERAVTRMLHMDFMLWFKGGTFVQELDKLVQDGVTPRLRAVVEKVGPVFAAESDALRREQASSRADDDTTQIDDVYTWTHRAIAQAMVILILGEQYATPAMTAHFMAIVVAIAHLSGIYENTQGWRTFPGLWSLKTTLVAVFGTVIPRFFFGVLPQLWRHRERHMQHGLDVEPGEYAPFFDLLVAKHRSQRTGQISFLNFVWCATVALGVIFASVHQTAVVAVWCVTALAQRQDEYLPALRDEWSQHIDVDADGRADLTIDALRQLSLLDSFVREVMRTKGDTFAPVRYTTRDVRVGRFVIPKNSLCAPYVRRAHEHPDNYGSDGARFDGFQWHHEQRPAVQGGHDFISFGLGRWACPGRHLAIAEIKMVLLALFRENDVTIEQGTYNVPDPMNATSVAPEAILNVRARTCAA